MREKNKIINTGKTKEKWRNLNQEKCTWNNNNSISNYNNSITNISRCIDSNVNRTKWNINTSSKC